MYVWWYDKCLFFCAQQKPKYFFNSSTSLFISLDLGLIGQVIEKYSNESRVTLMSLHGNFLRKNKGLIFWYEWKIINWVWHFYCVYILYDMPVSVWRKKIFYCTLTSFQAIFVRNARWFWIFFTHNHTQSIPSHLIHVSDNLQWLIYIFYIFLFSIAKISILIFGVLTLVLTTWQLWWQQDQHLRECGWFEKFVRGVVGNFSRCI